MDYEIKKMPYNGLPITFRVWKHYPVVEVRADKNLAKANGFSSIDEMFSVAMGTDAKNLERLPEWITITEEGDFLVRSNSLKKSEMN